MTMLKRMWRAFWAAMREPVRKYANGPVSTLQIEVEATQAEAVLDRLIVKAEKLKVLAGELDGVFDK